MTNGKISYAERQALNMFDKWNDCTGVIEKHCGYYAEAQACIIDAVHIGIQMALLGKVKYDEDGNVDKEGKIG